MSKLVAHEVEIGLTAQAECYETNHLVESNATVDHQGVIGSAHVVALGVEKPHGYGFVTDNSLIVALAIGNDLLLPPSVDHTVCDGLHVPVLVRRLLQQLDPHVG